MQVATEMHTLRSFTKNVNSRLGAPFPARGIRESHQNHTLLKAIVDVALLSKEYTFKMQISKSFTLRKC